MKVRKYAVCENLLERDKKADSSGLLASVLGQFYCVKKGANNLNDVIKKFSFTRSQLK